MPETAPLASIDVAPENFGLQITEHIERVFRIIMDVPGVDLEKRFIRLVTGEAHPFGNFVCMSHPAGTEDVTRACEPLLHCGAPAAALFVGPVEDDVHAVLTERGFERHGGMPAMAVEIDTLPETSLPEGYTFERVTRRDQRELWGDVFARGYEIPARVGDAFAGGITDTDAADAPVQYFWIRRDETPVCTSIVYHEGGIAGIYGVATLPEERGKGLGAHVTAEPLRRAHRLGYRIGVLQSSEAGYPVYQRLGFSDHGEIPLYVRMPDE